jgi:hypothetical protein
MGKPEFVEPNERIIEIVQAIVCQHNKMLDMHKTLIEKLAISPMLYLGEVDDPANDI